MEALGYAFGAIPFPSAGVGAPHIRDRLYWVAHANGREHDRGRAPGQGRRVEYPNGSATGGLDDAHLSGLEKLGGGYQAEGGRIGAAGSVAEASESGGLADNARSGRREERPDSGRLSFGDRAQGIATGLEHGGGGLRPGPVNGFWGAVDWLGCRDGKWRPVEPGTFPLAHGATARVGRLRAYGNAINAEAARVWIEAVMEAAC
jgi:DNA (cytosine-5)-methyltransferase 1